MARASNRTAAGNKTKSLCSVRAAVRAASTDILAVNISVMTFSSSIRFGAPNATDYVAQAFSVTLLKTPRFYCTSSNFCIGMSASTSQEAPTYNLTVCANICSLETAFLQSQQMKYSTQNRKNY